MNVLYVASRYHTNQIPIVKGWLKENNKVLFISQFQSESEDYVALEPLILGYAPFFKFLLKIYQAMNKKKLKNATIPNYFQAQFGFPPVGNLKKILKQFNPEVAILRDRCIYNAVVNHYCKKYNIPTILYNQSPVWENQVQKNDIFHKVIRKITPRIRMTPVLGKESAGTIWKENTFYVPFVIEPKCIVSEKKHFYENKINILCIGKYEDRKHHIELVKTISTLPQLEDIKVTLIGECSRETHKKYIEKLKQEIKRLDMESNVSIKTSVSYKSIYDEYKTADLFILPSTGEFASISQLEAMASSLPVICSDTNGFAECVHNGKNGYLFKDKDFVDLKEKIQLLIENKEKMLLMGKASYNIITEEYNFERYKKAIEVMLDKLRSMG